MKHKTVSTDDLWDLYKEQNSVHRVGAIVGLSPETVRKRLITVGHDISRNLWKDYEVQTLREWYETNKFSKTFDLHSLSIKLSRSKTSVSRKARELGISNERRKKTKERKFPLPPKFTNSEERNKATGERIRNYIKTNGHPKGSLGLIHSEETRQKLSRASKRSWRDPKSAFHTEEFKQKQSDNMTKRNFENPSPNPYSRCKRGVRADLGRFFFRSAWEANYARYLNLLIKQKQIKSWDYECQTFWFESIKRGVRSYKPDFKITLNNNSIEWHEVKGWLTDKGKTAINRFRKYYPTETLIIIDKAWFTQAKKQGLDGLLPNWE